MENPFDDSPWPDERQRIYDDASEIVGRRALIEQTKGMLMFVYGIDADAAFDILRSQSQQHNVKLRLIAEQIMTDLIELSNTKAPPRRIAFDGLLLTAHQRITYVAARQMNGQNKTDEHANQMWVTPNAERP